MPTHRRRPASLADHELPRPPRIPLLSAAAAVAFAITFISPVDAADVTFHIELVGEADVPGTPQNRHCGDLWAEGNYAYIGSDRNGGGISIFNISDPASPQYVTEYEGEEMEDVEVYNGIGFFGSDDNQATAATGTGVDIVNLTNPASPVLITRINAADLGHHKVHTLSVSDGYLYTTDNITDTIKIFNVANPASPQFVSSLDLGLSTGTGGIASHEVMAVNGRIYVASKATGVGWTHIYDVANVSTTGPVLLKAFQTGDRTHTSMPSEDGDTLVVSQERTNGEVRIYDISMIDQPNDPQTPVLLKTLTKPAADAHSPHHSHMHGDLLFLSWYEAGLQVYDMTDRANPLLVGAYDTFLGTSTDFSGNWGAFHGLGLDKVLLSDRERGLIIVDATGVVQNADFNADGAVDGADLLAWQRNLGTAASATLAQGDGNRDQAVSGLDLPVWQSQFGQSSGHHHASAVPESSALTLAITVAACLATRLRRRAQEL